MPFDGISRYNSWESPWRNLCRSCRRPVGISDKMQLIKVGYDAVHHVHQMNGSYHEACARPYLSLLRAFEAVTGTAR